MKKLKRKFLARAAMTLASALTRRTAAVLALAMLTTATAWAEVVNLTEDTDETEGTAARWYVNMKGSYNTSDNTLTLADVSITSFKVYDDGGKSGNYGGSHQDYLTITVPEGYRIQLSGNITTEKGCDKLTVWDGTDRKDDSKKLLNRVSSTISNTLTAITPVVSSGQSMTLYFESDGSSSYAGLDLTVTVFNPTTPHDVTISNPAQGGTVEASPTSAKMDDVITLTASPSSGYMLNDLTVKDADRNAIAVTDMLWYTNINTATFTMPLSAVTVTPTFTNNLSADGGLYVNMPTTSNKLCTVPADVLSFKVYDDGGPNNNYSSCDGYLTITAPTGCYLQLSGNIATSYYDKLTVWDGTDTNNNEKRLIYEDCSNPGDQVAINTVQSTSNSMTLYFKSSNGNNPGLDLTVTVFNPNAPHSITINNLNNVDGSVVTASINNQNVTSATVDQTVTLTASPASGYMLSGITATNANSNSIAVAWDGPFSNTATFTMPTSEVTVTPTFTNNLTADGGLYINMPATDSKSLTIPSSVQSFKVYDSGGSNGKYSDNCGGYLKLTAPQGYQLQLSGNIMTDYTNDYLTVWDGTDTTDDSKKLLNRVGSNGWGTQTAITTIVSSGESMTLYFFSDASSTCDGLDLTVTLINPNAPHSIAINNPNNVGGSVVTANPTSATVHQTVTLTASPASNYMLSGITATDANSDAVAVTWDGWFSNTATFTMPASEVTVTPTFTNNLTVDGGIYINMPATGSKSITIPSGTQSFKVYDDGGSKRSYSDNCDGYLTLTAPTGYRIQLTGSINTQGPTYVKDYLIVYDGIDNTATELIQQMCSTANGTWTDIPLIVSSGESMTLNFKSDDTYNFNGLDLTVRLVDPEAYHSITVNNPDNVDGSIVTANPTSAKLNQDVTLTADPAEGYILYGITATDANNNAVPLTWDGWFSNTATFTMPGFDVTVTPTFTNDLTVNSLYFNIPKAGSKPITIPNGVQSFKVYDHGGKDGSYGNCDGSLVLTAPEGYILQLTGSVSTSGLEHYDYLTVYDNNETSGTKLVDEMWSTGANVPTDIPTVTSSGRYMTLYFYSELSGYDGLNLTVTLAKNDTKYGITINNPDNVDGSVVTADLAEANVNQTVTLTSSPANGYLLSGITVTDASSNDITVAWDGPLFNTATFSMPGSAVTVTPTFTNNLTADGGLYINMPTTGEKSATIPSGVQSFKVYDDGGKDGNYSPNCNGYLKLTAPEGYVLQLSGTIYGETDDRWTIYDGTSTTDDMLIREMSGYGYQGTRDLYTVSTGRNMMIYFNSDDDNYCYPGLNVTATIGHRITVADGIVHGAITANDFAADNETVNLTITPNAGYEVGTVSYNGTEITPVNGVYSFTMPANDVVLSATFTAIEYYIAADGTKQQCIKYTELTGTETTLAAGWYVAKGTVNYTGALTLSGDVNLILADNATVNIGTEETPVSGNGIGDDSNNATITIYGQSKGADRGHLKVYASGCGIWSSNGDFNCYNAKVTVKSSLLGIRAQATSDATKGNINMKNTTVNVNTTNGSFGYNIYAQGGNITIDDCDVTTTANGGYNISSEGDITINNCNVTATTTKNDVINAAGGNVTINGGKVTATGGTSTVGISAQKSSTGGDITLTDATVIATCGTGIMSAGGNITINSGNVTATASYYYGIYANGGNVAINGGIVEANGNSPYSGISANNITLGWTSTGDQVTANSYDGTVKIADGQAFTDGNGHYYAGTLTDDEKSAISGKTLTRLTALQLADAADNSAAIAKCNGATGLNITLQGRTLTKDGNWNTLCLPFSLSAEQIAASSLAGATIKELDNAADATSLSNDGTLTLKFTDDVTTIDAGKPYIVKWTTTGDNISNPVFEGVTIASTTPTAVKSDDGNVTFVGQYSPFGIVDTNINSIIMLGANNTLGYSQNNRTLRSFRAHFEVPETANVREFVLDFGDDVATGIVSIHNSQSTMHNDAWYTIDGRKLGSKPTAKGVYVNNGKKIVIK